MAHRIFDRCQQYITDTGAGFLNLGATVPKMVTPAAAGMAINDTCWALIEHQDPFINEWEICKATLLDAGGGARYISRSGILKNSLGTNAPINFSPGTKVFALVAPSERSVIADDTGTFIFSLPVLTKGSREFVVPLPIVAGVVNMDLLAGGVYTLPVTANITTINLLNKATGYGHSFTVEFAANGTGYTQAWPWVWVNGTPILTTTNGKKDLAVVWSIDGINFFGAMAAQNY